MEGRIHSVESFGSADGPGVRFVIFLQGCPMRCRYCHNPDTWSTAGGTLRDVDDLLDQAERYRAYWGADGGITVSGGEALLQLPFLVELFEHAHERNINTCLDTSLAPFTRREPWISEFARLMRSCDLVMADLKDIDPEGHQWLCGMGNDGILDGLRWLADMHVPVWIRHVLVPGITDDTELLERTRSFIDTLGNVERVDVLPYHTLGIFKWDELGIPYTLRDTKPPTPAQLAHARRILCAPSEARSDQGGSQ